MGYRSYQTTPPAGGGLAPTALLQPAGIALEGGLGDVKDALADRMKLAVLARLTSQAPPDALQAIGVDRGIPRGPGEADAAYSARLTSAWATWPYAGTAQGLLRALNDSGYPNTAIVQQLGGVYTLNASLTLSVTASPRWTFDTQSPLASPAAWTAASSNTDGILRVPTPQNGYFYRAVGSFTSGSVQPVWPTAVGASVADNGGTWVCGGRDFWSRFSVVFFAPLPSSWGGTPPSYSSAEITRIRGIINQWRSAHSTCVSIIVITAGRVLGYPVRTLGGGNGTLGGATTTVYSPV